LLFSVKLCVSADQTERDGIMATDEITQIRVGGDRVGIVGLKIALSELAETCSTRSDQQIASELMERLGRRNYIHVSA